MNRGPLESEVTALPTEPQPLPTSCIVKVIPSLRNSKAKAAFDIKIGDLMRGYLVEKNCKILFDTCHPVAHIIKL